jgi:pilus assembly protein Flp/PilA
MKRWQEKGQGLVEYALLLALVSIVVVAILMLLGPTIGNIFSEIIKALTPL